MAKKCIFSQQWLDNKSNPDFAGWLDLVPEDSSSAYCAYCKVCFKSFRLSNMGRQAVVSHAKGPKHVKNLTSKCLQPSISYFAKKNYICRAVCCAFYRRFNVYNNSSLCLYFSSSFAPDKTFSVNEDDVTSAEIMWALEVVTGKMSLNSCDGSVSAFKRMFPDSQIAQNFAMGKTKASYIIYHGLSPYFRDCLETDLKNCNDYVVCFDESLNKVVQRGQMDIVVRFWDVNQQRVATRYFNSVFLGQSTADHLLEGFVEGLSLPFDKILQVTMDGPNVNLGFIKKLENKLKVDNPDGKTLLDIGVCGLHTVNGAVKTGLLTANWDLYHNLRAMYCLFKDSPARRAKYTETTGSTHFPLKFTSVRWLENGVYVHQALKIYGHVEKFVKGACIQGNKNLEYLKESMKDPLLEAKLAAFKSVIAECEPFLRRFQSQKPLVPFLYTALQEVIRNLMARFVKQKSIAEASTAYKLMTLDLSDSENLIPVDKVVIGYGAKKLLRKVKCTDKDKSVFKHEFRNFLISMVEKLKAKSPLKSHLARGLTCFDPRVIFYQSSLGVKRIDVVLEELHCNKRVSDELAERAKKQYTQLLVEAQSEKWQKQFTDFACDDKDTVALDEFFYTLFGNDKRFDDLLFVIKLCFILSYGNASVESGFSVNKCLLVENLLEESLVAQRIVYDAVKSMGGSKEVTVTRSMLTSVRASRRRYQAYLEKKRQINAEGRQKEERKKKNSART